MKTRGMISAAAAIVCGLLSTQAVSAGGSVQVLAPAEMAGPLRNLEVSFESRNPGSTLDIHYVPANRMDRELQGRMDEDLVILSDDIEMKSLAARNAVVPTSVKVFAVDRLVLCAPAYQPLGNLQELEGEKVHHIAIINPGRSESGMKAIMALNKAGVWTGAQPKIVHGKNPGEVLEYLTKQSAQAGLLYWSEVAGNDQVRIVGTFERPYSDPIRYASAVSSTARNLEAARQLQAFLASNEAQGLLKALGYHPE